MKTAGFDIVLLINEDLLNQVSGALFYNNFMTFNGKKDLKESLSPDILGKIPANMHDLLEVRYRFKLLYEPYINFKDPDRIEITAKLRVYIWFMQGLELKFDASITLGTNLSIDNNNKKFKILLNSNCIVRFVIDYRYSDNSLVPIPLTSLFRDALIEYLNKPETTFDIDMPTISPYLPYTPLTDDCKVPVDVRAIRVVNNSTLAIAVNLFKYEGGNIDELNDFARNCNVAAGLSLRAMTKVYDLFWEKTTWPKKFHKGDVFKIEMVDKALDFITDLSSFIWSTSVQLMSMGWAHAEVNFISSQFDYSVDIDFKTKPTFDLQDGNKVVIYNLGVDLFIRLRMFATFERKVSIAPPKPIQECTKWNDEIVLEDTIQTVKVIDLAVPIYNLVAKECTGVLSINETERHLECKVTKLDVNIYDYVAQTCEFLKLPKDIQDKIINGLKQKVVDSIKPYVLSPVIFRLDTGLFDWKLNIEGRKIEVNNGEAIAGAYLYFRELQNELWPVPKYIVNINNKEVHLAGCDSIMDTYETHQRGFYLLHNALKKNDGCKKCLPAFHTR
jgi:hypothetical protein